MTDNSRIVNERPPSLGSEEILQAVSQLFAPDKTVAAGLEKLLKKTLHGWQQRSAVDGSVVSYISHRFFSGLLAEALSLPGELIIIRDGESGFRLLNCRESRWQYVAGDGSFHPVDLNQETGTTVDALIVRVSKPRTTDSGFTSLISLWPKLRSAWAEVGMASLFINSGQLLVPLFSMLVYDKIAQNGLFETLWALTFGMGLYLATDIGMRLVRSWATERIGADLTLQGDESIWAKLVAQVELPPGGFPRFISNYRDLTQSRDFVSSSYLLSIADIPFLILYLAVIGIIAWQLMVVVFVLVVIYTTAGLVMQKRQNRLSREAEQSNTRKLTFMGETLGCLDIVRTTPGGVAFLRRWRALIDESVSAESRRRFSLLQTGMLSSSTYTVTTVVMLTAGVYLIHGQQLSSGRLIACSLLATRAMALVASLFAVTGKWEDFKRAAARMEDSLEPVAMDVLTPRPEIVGEITVIGLGKRYEGRPAALEAVSCSIRPGERVALLGRPGAGKSTLLRCLAGLCRPDSGQIQIDGLALDDISRFDRVKWLAYKSQDPALFAGTLEDNIRISGCSSQERFAEAIWASGLEAELKSGRMSLGMQLEERGSNLSGGQKQKVALARAFAQSSRILLLDEPTLGLDPESEKMLAERLPKLLGTDSILIMTTHSATMLQSAQRIIALDGGRLVADGPRDKLITLS